MQQLRSARAGSSRIFPIDWLIEWSALGSSPYGPDAPRPYKQTLVSLSLKSAQESPVPLPKFQMAPRLKILMFSGSKKGTKIYYSFLSKSPVKRIPTKFPRILPTQNLSKHTVKYKRTCKGVWGARWPKWLKYYATNRQVAGSIPDGVNGIILPVALWSWESTQPLT